MLKGAGDGASMYASHDSLCNKQGMREQGNGCILRLQEMHRVPYKVRASTVWFPWRLGYRPNIIGVSAASPSRLGFTGSSTGLESVSFFSSANISSSLS